MLSTFFSVAIAKKNGPILNDKKLARVLLACVVTGG